MEEMKITIGILIVLTLAFWLAMFKGGGVRYGQDDGRDQDGAG